MNSQVQLSLQTASIHSPGAKHQPIRPLSAEERAAYQTCNQRIAAGFETYIDVGQALRTVRDGELYREEFKLFDDYCRCRWQISRSYACRLMNASELAELMLPAGNIPRTERQMRPLLGFSGEQASDIWQAVLELAHGEPITPKHIRDSVSAFRTRKGDAGETVESHTVSYLHELLVREARKMNRLVSVDDTGGVLQCIERIKLLIERYAAGESQTSDSLT